MIFEKVSAKCGLIATVQNRKKNFMFSFNELKKTEVIEKLG